MAYLTNDIRFETETKKSIYKKNKSTKITNILSSHFANVVLESNETPTLRAIVCFKLKSLILLFVILYNRK